MKQLQVSIVTPEMTTFEARVDSVVVPMYDGELGIYPGHSPLIGRLGPGELRATAGSVVHTFYVEGGFVQVADDTVAVLTGRSMKPEQIDVAAARDVLEEARDNPASKPDAAEFRNRKIAQATAQIRIAERR
jgi:F-type H+-transporting ATPase subunit epsilon